MDEGERARMTVAAFGAAGSAVSLGLQKQGFDKDWRLRVARGVTSFVAGVCCAVLIAPLAAPSFDNLLRVDAKTTEPLLGFIFGVTGYEMCKVVYHRCSKFFNALADKKERELLKGDSGPEVAVAEESDE